MAVLAAGSLAVADFLVVEVDFVVFVAVDLAVVFLVAAGLASLSTASVSFDVAFAAATFFFATGFSAGAAYLSFLVLFLTTPYDPAILLPLLVLISPLPIISSINCSLLNLAKIDHD